MKPNPKSLIMFMLMLTILSTSTSNAHSDDRGDVHPLVEVKGDRFEVTFYNNETKKVFVSIVDSKGRILSERKPSKVPVNEFEKTIFPRMESHKISDSHKSFVVPVLITTPTAHVFEVKNGKREKIPLEWDKPVVDMVYDAVLHKIGIVTLLSTQPKTMAFPLRIEVFCLKTKKNVRSATIASPLRIWSFPQCSYMECNETHAFVAWLGRRGKEDVDLKLSRFDFESGKLETKTLRDGASNTNPSLGIIGNQILIAYHKPQNLRNRTGSQIVYYSSSIDEIFRKSKSG